VKAKRYLIKWMAVMISVASVLTMPAYGADTKPILKAEDAIKSAISYSNQISINSSNNNALKEQLKFNDSTTYYQYQSIYLQKAQNEQQREMIEDQIANDIVDQYNTMIIMGKEISLISKNIDIASKELRQMALQNKKGLINPVTYQSKEVEITNLKNNKLAKDEELKNAQLYFRIITGKDMTKYTLEDQIGFEPFRIAGLVEGYISSKVSLYLQYDKELADLRQDNILMEGAPAPTYASYLAEKSSATTALLTLEDKERNLKQTLISTYSTLLNLEEQINNQKSQLSVLDKKLKSAELHYKAGLMSVLAYDKELTAQKEAELQMMKLVSRYNSLKESIQKPWVLSAGNTSA
jgi:outer membrane protein TolC